MRILLFFVFSAIYGYAQIVNPMVHVNVDPLRTLEKVHPKGELEKVLKLSNAKVVIADYKLIRRDFSALTNLSNSEIDDWILDQVAYVSQGQASQQTVNTFIETNDQITRKGYRPPEYGRALVYDVDYNSKSLGVIDVKGAGGINPSHASHRSGTMTLGESLREFSYEKMVSTVVDHSGVEKKVVGGYAVIDPGFDVIHPDNSQSRAGLYLRQGHRRYTQAENLKKFNVVRGNGWMDDSWRSRYDDLLKKYGIFANTNYQGTVNNDLFDFGHYIIRGDIGDDALRVPFEQWGFDKAPDEEIFTSKDRWRFSKRDRPWIWSHDTAEAFAKGTASRHDVWMNHYNLVRSAQDKLKDTPRLYEYSKSLGFNIKVCERVFQIQN